MAPISLKADTLINAPIGKVWQVLTNKQSWVHWYGVPIIAASFHNGGSITFGGQYGGTSQICEFILNTRLVIRGSWADDIYVLSEQNGSTLLETEIIPRNGAQFTDDGLANERSKRQNMLSSLSDICTHTIPAYAAPAVCAACGAALEVDAHFCRMCGTAVANAASESSGITTHACAPKSIVSRNTSGMLAWSIVNTVFGYWLAMPIIAIVKTVNSSKAANPDEFERQYRTARTLNIVTSSVLVAINLWGIMWTFFGLAVAGNILGQIF
ncbi:MAG: SRPBCC domain-containing protein [Clostridia bacterium]